jgi:hypothetical protein
MFDYMTLKREKVPPKYVAIENENGEFEHYLEHWDKGATEFYMIKNRYSRETKVSYFRCEDGRLIVNGRHEPKLYHLDRLQLIEVTKEHYINESYADSGSDGPYIIDYVDRIDPKDRLKWYKQRGYI